MGLKDIGESLPPGFRFYPSDEELVCHYLQKKIDNEELLKGTLVEIDLHTCEPWQLPEVAKLNANEWYFFSFRDRKYATGFRTNRATTFGYWKATGKDRVILDLRTRMTVGMRKTLVFYRNRAPNGIKTGWIMHEYRLESPHMPPKEDWVLCRVFHKNRAENTANHDSTPHNMYNHTNGGNSPPTLASSHAHHPVTTVPSGFYQANSFSSNSSSAQISYHSTNQNSQSTLDLASSSSNLLHYLKDQSDTNSFINFKSACDEEEYGVGFLWDVNHLVDCGFGDMDFEDDNGVVLL